MSARLTLATALAPLSWGTTYLVTTLWLPADRPLFSAVVRALPAGVLAVAIGRHLPRGRWWARALLLGTLNIGAFFTLLFIAAYRLPGGVAATVGATGPLMVAGLARLLLGEVASRWRLGWALAAVLGVALLTMRPQSELDPVGLMAALAGTASMSTGVVLTRRWGNPLPRTWRGSISFAGWQLTAGSALLLPLAAVFEPGWPSLNSAATLGYGWLTAVGALLAYSLWFRGIGQLPVVAAAFLALVSPLVATVLGWVVLDQRLGLVSLAGFMIAMVAVAAGQVTPTRAASLAQPADAR